MGCSAVNHVRFVFLTDNYIFFQWIQLLSSIPGLTISELHRTLAENAASLEGGDIFDILNSFSDFEEFKGLMLSHKAQAGGT